MRHEYLANLNPELWKRVVESPRDDFPRMAFADWLEEYGRSDDADRIRAAIADPRIARVVGGTTVTYVVERMADEEEYEISSLNDDTEDEEVFSLNNEAEYIESLNNESEDAEASSRNNEAEYIESLNNDYDGELDELPYREVVYPDHRALDLFFAGQRDHKVNYISHRGFLSVLQVTGDGVYLKSQRSNSLYVRMLNYLMSLDAPIHLIRPYRSLQFSGRLEFPFHKFDENTPQMVFANEAVVVDDTAVVPLVDHWRALKGLPVIYGLSMCRYEWLGTIAGLWLRNPVLQRQQRLSAYDFNIHRGADGI